MPDGSAILLLFEHEQEVTPCETILPDDRVPLPAAIVYNVVCCRSAAGPELEAPLWQAANWTPDLQKQRLGFGVSGVVAMCIGEAATRIGEPPGSGVPGTLSPSSELSLLMRAA